MNALQERRESNRNRAGSKNAKDDVEDIEVLKLSDLLNEDVQFSETDELTESQEDETLASPNLVRGENHEVASMFDDLNRSIDKKMYTNSLKRSFALQKQMQGKVRF